MKRELSAAAYCLLMASWGIAGDTMQVIGYDNVHIRVADPANAVDWYVKYLGAASVVSHK